MDHLNKAKNLRNLENLYDYAADATVHDSIQDHRFGERTRHHPGKDSIVETHFHHYNEIAHCAKQAKDRHLEAHALRNGNPTEYRKVAHEANDWENLTKKALHDMRNDPVYPINRGYHRHILGRARRSIKVFINTSGSNRRRARLR